MLFYGLGNNNPIDQGDETDGLAREGLEGDGLERESWRGRVRRK
jgi:hypothetical protein